MLETGTSGLMSGAGKRGGVSASVLAPGLDSTQTGQPQLPAKKLRCSLHLFRVEVTILTKRVGKCRKLLEPFRGKASDRGILGILSS